MADSPAYPGAPRWVKILGFISVVLVVAFVAAHLAGGGFRHHGHVGGEPEPGTGDKGPS